MDDGCNHASGFELNTSGFTLNDVKILQKVLFDNWSIETSIHSRNRLYINSKSKSRIQNSPMPIEKASGYNISLGPSVFLNEHVALEFLLGYKQVKVKSIGDNKNTTFNTGLGLQIHLGKIRTKAKT